MHTRERGAAHVNIFFPLILLVLLFGAGGFAYIKHTEVNELRDERAAAVSTRNKAVNENLAYQAYVRELAAYLGETGEYKSGDETFQNVVKVDKLDSLFKAFASKTGVPLTQVKPVSAFLGQIQVQLDNKDKTVANLTAQAAKAQTEVTQAQQALAAANAAHQGKATQYTTDKTEVRQYVDTEFNKRDTTISALQQNLQTRRTEMETLKDDHATAMTAMTKERDLTKAHNDALAGKIRMVNSPQTPDGAVISSSEAAGKAWVNIGRKDMLPLGTVFSITGPRGAAIKAYGTVSRVEYDRAEVTISGLVDRFDPVVTADLIRNDLYSPNLKRNIFLMGRFSFPHTKPAVKVILENLGNKVHAKISPAVDLIIVGGDSVNDENSGFTPITETQEYKDALFYGIEMAPMNKVRQYIKLDAGTKITKK